MYCFSIQSFNVFLSFLGIIDKKGQIFLKNDTLVFIKMNDEDLQHCSVQG